MKPLLLLIPMLVLAGCISAPRVEDFTTPDGKPGHVAYCGGYANQMTDCHAVARKTCGGNYRVLGERESVRTVDADSPSTMNRRLEFICDA